MKKITMLVALSILLTMLIGQVAAMAYGPAGPYGDNDNAGRFVSTKTHPTEEAQERAADAWRTLRRNHEGGGNINHNQPAN